MSGVGGTGGKGSAAGTFYPALPRRRRQAKIPSMSTGGLGPPPRQASLNPVQSSRGLRGRGIQQIQPSSSQQQQLTQNLNPTTPITTLLQPSVLASTTAKPPESSTANLSTVVEVIDLASSSDDDEEDDVYDDEEDEEEDDEEDDEKDDEADDENGEMEHLCRQVVRMGVLDEEENVIGKSRFISINKQVYNDISQVQADLLCLQFRHFTRDATIDIRDHLDCVSYETEVKIKTILYELAAVMTSTAQTIRKSCTKGIKVQVNWESLNQLIADSFDEITNAIMKESKTEGESCCQKLRLKLFELYDMEITDITQHLQDIESPKGIQDDMQTGQHTENEMIGDQGEDDYKVEQSEIVILSASTISDFKVNQNDEFDPALSIPLEAQSLSDALTDKFVIADDTSNLSSSISPSSDVSLNDENSETKDEKENDEPLSYTPSIEKGIHEEAVTKSLSQPSSPQPPPTSSPLQLLLPTNKTVVKLPNPLDLAIGEWVSLSPFELSSEPRNTAAVLPLPIANVTPNDCISQSSSSPSVILNEEINTNEEEETKSLETLPISEFSATESLATTTTIPEVLLHLDSVANSKSTTCYEKDSPVVASTSSSIENVQVEKKAVEDDDIDKKEGKLPCHAPARRGRKTNFAYQTAEIYAQGIPPSDLSTVIELTSVEVSQLQKIYDNTGRTITAYKWRCAVCLKTCETYNEWGTHMSSKSHSTVGFCRYPKCSDYRTRDDRFQTHLRDHLKDDIANGLYYEQSTRSWRTRNSSDPTVNRSLELRKEAILKDEKEKKDKAERHKKKKKVAKL